MGPLLHRATRHHHAALPPAWRDLLLGADLTARVTSGCAIDTMLEVLDACDALQVCVTLLKGISVSEQFYPAEHLRPMSDIDVLIPANAYSDVEAALLDRGYVKLADWNLPGHQHGAPLRHVRRRTIVELHTRLFREDSPLRTDGAFGESNVAAQSMRSRYHARPVKRLTPEMQLAYIASSWFNDLTLSKFHPSFIASLFDAVYLLKASGRTLDWRGLLGWLDNDLAAASLYALLTYLPRFGVEPVPSPVLKQLASGQRMVGPIQLRLIHKALDRHLVGARPWALAVPPPVPGRYNPLHQFEKRVLSRLRRATPQKA